MIIIYSVHCTHIYVPYKWIKEIILTSQFDIIPPIVDLFIHSFDLDQRKDKRIYNSQFFVFFYFIKKQNSMMMIFSHRHTYLTSHKTTKCTFRYWISIPNDNDVLIEGKHICLEFSAFVLILTWAYIEMCLKFFSVYLRILFLHDLIRLKYRQLKRKFFLLHH